MAVSAVRITVSSTAVALLTPDHGGARLILKNTDGANAVDLGDSTVSAGGGYPLSAGAVQVVEVESGEVVWAVRSTGSDVVLGVLRT